MLRLVVNPKIKRRALKPVRPSRAAELWYKSELLSIVRLITRETEAAIMPVLRAQEHTWVRTRDGVANDGIIADINSVFTALARRFTGLLSIGQRVATMAASRVRQDVDSRLQRTIKSSLGVDITGLLSGGALSSTIDDAVAANVSLIKSIPEQYLFRVQQAVSSGVAKGLRADEISSTISAIDNITENRAKLIARDQISKMNGAINRIRQTAMGVEKYRWQTSGDERVRPEHKAHDGKVFEWDNPPDDTGHPGEDINCRCVAIPIFEADEP